MRNFTPLSVCFLHSLPRSQNVSSVSVWRQALQSALSPSAPGTSKSQKKNVKCENPTHPSQAKAPRSHTLLTEKCGAHFWHCICKGIRAALPMALQVLVVLVSLGAVSELGAALRPCPWSSQQPSLNWKSLGHPHSSSTKLQWVPRILGMGVLSPRDQPRWLSSPAKPTVFGQNQFFIPCSRLCIGGCIPATTESSCGHGTNSHGQVNCWFKGKLMKLTPG